MKKKMGIRTLAAILAASVVMSASTGMVSAKNYGSSVSATGDVSDTSAASEATTRSSAKIVSSNVSVEGAALNGVKIPTGLSGAGTIGSPYQIGSLNDLLLMNSYINYEDSSAKEFVLVKDIDLSKVTFSHFTESDGVWSLVSAKASLSGNGNVHFHLNGNGHKLYGMNTSVSKNVTTGAIFGYINANSVIENLTVESCTLRVNRASDGAFAVFAVQNNGTIKGCTMIDCVLDARLGSVQTCSTDEGYVSGLSGNRIYVGHALGVADNAGKVLNFTVTGTDTNKGVFIKGGRRFVGIIAGQNRKDISDVTVSGVRIVSYGSDDGDSSVSGKGQVAAYVGVAAGRNDKSATVSSATITLKYGADILFGSSVGGVVGENAGTIENSMVSGTNATGVSVSSSTANLYGYGRYGAIAGVSSGTIRGCGAYDIGFCFAQNDEQNAYGGIVGANSGSITNCAATGSANLQNSASAGMGGLVGQVQSGMTLMGNYAIVSASRQGDNVGALIGKDGTVSYIGQNNFWTSQGSGVTTPVPHDGVGQNDLTAAKRVIVLTKSTSGVTLGASALDWSWQNGKLTASADFSKPISVSNKTIRLSKTTNSVTLSCTDDGEVGTLDYTVTVSVPAGISGHKLSAHVSIPVFATASTANGAGANVKNPIVISNAQQMQIMQYAPNAHYKLSADITLGSDWTPVDFGGTLNGGGHTLRISKPIFSSVTGSRNGSVSDADWKYVGTNLISGYIYDMTIVPSACVYGGVFGEVKNATLRDVTYTVNDENDGFVALSAAKSGALIDTLSGNAFLYRCKVSVPIAVTAGDAEGIGALVGYAASANLIAEECETSSLISLENNLANVGGLFGNISGKGTAELVNCRATGCVYVNSVVSDVRANIMIGAASGAKASGCTYAVSFGVAGGSVAKNAAPFSDGITELNPQSKEAKQGAEDARSMLTLIDAEQIEEAQLSGLSTEGGIYKLRTAQDVLDMMSLLNRGDLTDAAHTGTFELQNDIDMNGAELRMATTADTAFAGIFRSVSGSKYTLSNFTVTNTGTDTSDPYTNPESIYYTAAALFCYANGATFTNFALSDVTVVSDGVGTAVLVGFADKDGDVDDLGAYSECSFTNIDITECNVYSNFTVDGTGYALESSALAGTLIGAVWSANGGDIYTITDITVSDCSVINRNWDSEWTYYNNPNDYANIGGSWSIGGLIGGSRVTDGTLCIGASGGSASVTLEHITVVGYGGVGGVIGMAGPCSMINAAGSSATALTSRGASGGLEINNVTVCGKTDGNTVQRSSITAGTIGTDGGSCGGILGIELVSVGGATISGCTVSDTDILSDNDVSNMGGYATDCGGIAGHMSGTVENCTVEDCTIKSCVAGGIVGRSSRKATNTASNTSNTLVTVTGCQVKGDTTIGFDGVGTSNNNGEAGGIVASARYASVAITNCSVGSKVTISSAHWLYAGGFIGYTIAASANYTVVIQNSITAAKVEITAAITDSAVGGAIGYAGMHYMTDSTSAGTTMSKQVVKRCVIGGTLKDVDYYCGGVFGALKAYTTTSSGLKVFDIEDSVVAAKLESTTSYTAKLLAYYYGAGTAILDQASRWMGANNIKRAVKRTVFSSYPQDIECFGYYKNGSNYLTLGSKVATLSTDSLITAGSVEDVNKPGGTNYLNGESAAQVLDGNNATRTFTINITNLPKSATSGDATFTTTLMNFDSSNGAGSNTDKKYSGWVSSNFAGQPVNNYFEVKSDTTATVVNLSAKLDATDVGVTANFDAVGFTDPDTSNAVQLAVYIPLTLTQIPPPGLEGDGSAGDPWQITNLTELNSLRNRDLTKNANSTGTDKGYYILMNDIDASGEGFTPITDKNHSDGPFMGTFDGNGKTISGLTITDANTGLFASTNGATIYDLTISGAQVRVADNSTQGLYAAVLVGVANETTFRGITIGDNVVEEEVNGETITTTTHTVIGGVSDTYPSAYAGALAAYATDTVAQNITLTNVTVRYAYFTGGLFGHAHYSGATGKENKILGATINGLTVTSTSLDTTTVYDGTNSGKIDAAGGIVAEFAGTIGSYTNGGTTTANTLSGTVSVNGSIASGAVGIVDRTLTTASSCTVGDVTVGDGTNAVTISSGRTLANKATAGGIVGKICTDAPSSGTTVTSPAVTVTVSDCTVKSGVSISAKLHAGGILGHSGANGSASPITIESCSSFANVSEDVTESESIKPGVGAIVGYVYDLPHLSIDLCVASGALSAVTNAGGVVGVVPTGAPALEAADGVRISNTVVSASLTVSGENAIRGVLFGSAALYQLPDNLSASPFSNIYYSSYQIPSALLTISGGVQKIGKLTGENAYLDYQTTCIDLMTDFAFTSDGSSYSSMLRVPRAGVTLNANATGTNSIRLWQGDVSNSIAGASGTYASFTCSTDVDFVLDTIECDLITFNKATRHMDPKTNDSGDAVFLYENGLKLKLDLIASDIKGDGTLASPFLIERIGHLNAIKTMPDKYYVLAADIDFDFSDTETTYYTAHGQLLSDAGWATGTAEQQERLAYEEITPSEKLWASKWNDWAKSLLREDQSGGQYTYRFTGTLVGEWYAYDYSTDTYASGGDKTQHTISNLSVTTSGVTDDQNNVIFTGAGLFPVIESGASVSKVKFSSCSFTATSSALFSNVGVLVGENKGTINGVEADNCTVSATKITTSGTNETQAQHVGAIAGISYGAISNCVVTNSTVTSAHCAGGVVGGGASVSGSKVSNTTVTGRHYAGGIAGGNLNYASSSVTEVPSELKQTMQTCTYSNCSVSGCTIQSQQGRVASSVGGILGIAEAGDNSTYGYRSVTIDHCTVDCTEGSHKKDKNAHTTIKALADTTNTSAQQENFAGGMLGQVVDYYDGIVLESNVSYASVYAYGDYRAGNMQTAASSLLGRVQGADHFKAYDSGTVKFRFINNVCGGDLHSAYIAGGVCGLFGANSAGCLIPANAEFACGNIISASFELLAENRNSVTTYNSSSDGFGVFMGICTPLPSEEGVTIVGCFAADAAPSTMTDNYYSSYVSKIGNNPVPHFSTSKSAVTACGELYDVAAYSTASATYSSSFLVKNLEYSGTTLEEVAEFKDSVTAPEYYDTVNEQNVYPGSYNMNMQLMFNTTYTLDGENNRVYNHSVDFADPTKSLTVYTTGISGADQHTLCLTETADITVNPNGSTEYYAAERAVSAGGMNQAKLTINTDPATCTKAYKLVADLEYGLLVGITIKTPSGTGELGDPYKISNAATFAHYFFAQDAVMDANHLYLQKYYAQTADIDFNDILDVISGTADPYEDGETYGYNNGTQFVQGVFVPIGTETAPFYGGYNGGWTPANSENGIGHKITNFHYTAPAGMTDVGLFGYVADQTTAGEGDHRLKNIHIEMAETALDTDDYIPAANSTVASASPTNDEHAGIFGGLNTGGLVGRYTSGCAIENCSVVYGTVSSDNSGANVGGLIGNLQGSAALQNCFTSTNVRVRDNIRTSSEMEGSRENYTCGGLVGLQESGSASAAVSCTYDNCFSSSDVVGPYFVGGFVGKVGLLTHIELTNCASTATVTGLYQFLAGSNILATPLVVGYKPTGEGTATYAETGDDDPRYVKAVNVYVAGMNTTEYRVRGSSQSGDQYYSALFGLRPLLNGSSGIYYDSSVTGRLTLPNGTANPNILLLTGEVRTKNNAPTNETSTWTMGTAALTAADHALGTGAFDTSNDALYPVLQMKDRGDSGQLSSDPYYAAFSTLSALPMHTDERELDDVSADRTYVGVTYPTMIVKSPGDEFDYLVEGVNADPALTIVSSKYSASTDTLTYNANYDHLLEGNDGRTDMQTDLLFDRNGSSYRILRNTNLTSGISYYRNERSPFVRVSGRVNNMEIHRTIHVGLRSSANTSYVATERQLRAITAPEASGKFSTAFSGTLTDRKNIRLCADIEFNPNPTLNAAFTPIIGFEGTNPGDQDEGSFGFDGSNCVISNMRINTRQYAGMFEKIEGSSGTPTIQNLILRNPTVSGSIAAGALVGQVNHTDVLIKNCSVIGGTITATQQSVSVGGLVGLHAGGNVQWVGVTGVTIATTTSTTNTAATNAGLMFGSVTGAELKDVYASGEMIVNATNVGGLAGSASNCTVSGAVTSGYVECTDYNTGANANNDSNVGGIFGKMGESSTNGMVLNNAISTAFVTGGNYYAGIVGYLDSGKVSNTIFAGSTGGDEGDAISIMARGTAPSTPTTICYDSSLQRTDPESKFHPLTTWEIVSGTNAPFNQDSTFAYDTTTYRYYPNPVNTVGSGWIYGSISNVITDTFKTGLAFALARVNMVYAGTGGSIEEYDEITATSPIGSINSTTTIETVNGEDTTVLTDKVTIGTANSLDTITLAEYDTANENSRNGDNEGYLIVSGDSLTPRIWEPDARTGVRATLNTESGSTFEKKNANEALKIYRFVTVNACRMAEIEYTVSYADTAAALDVTADALAENAAAGNNKIVLMLKTQENPADAPLTAFSSNAVTSKYQDSDTTSGNTYVVKYRKIAVPSDGKIYVGAMLPSQYRLSDVKAYEYNFGTSAYGSNIYGLEGQGAYVYLDGSVNTTANTKVKIDVTIAADPSWGLRDLTGGIN